MDPNISDYEKVRLQNIQRNEQYLQQIGIEKKRAVTQTKVSKPKKVRLDVEDAELSSIRRSSRVAQLQVVSYTEVSTQLLGLPSIILKCNNLVLFNFYFRSVCPQHLAVVAVAK